jgi:TonB family protein
MTTMIAETPRKTSLGVGFESNRTTRPNAEAWKQHMGSKQVPARLALLPEAKPNWARVGVSAVLQISILAFFVIIPLLYPEKMKTAVKYGFMEIAQPLTEIPVAPPPPPPPKIKTAAPKVEPKPEVPVEQPKLNPQQQHIFTALVAPKVQPKVQPVDTKLPDMNAKVEQAQLDTKDNGPKRPKEDVKVNNLNSGSAAPATVVAPVNKVQTGGFGDPNGMPANNNSNKGGNINRLGSPALPNGEGYGNGTAGKEGIRGTVASTGFGNGTATPPAGGGSGKKVATGGFGDASSQATDAPKKKAQTGPADTGITIISKPRPEYTAEGRSLKIEGNVVLDVVFLANGTVQVNKVVSGLGHGLDESAVKAAEQIKFKPALYQNTPVDFPARLRIEFQLAY